MGKIDLEYAKRCARFAALDLEESNMIDMLDKVNSYLGEIDKIDVSSIDDSLEAYTYPLDGACAFRDDEVNESTDRDILLSNCANHDGSAYLVPKMLD